MSIPLALAAALLFAVGSVLQQRVAATTGELGLLQLARRPLWVAGLGADAAGYACQVSALAFGRLAVVQPLLALSLVLALPLGAALDHRRVTRPELIAALAVAGGLAAFLTLADPTGGRDDASAGAWVATFAVCGAVCVFARRGGGGAVSLGCATGVLFGLSAALTLATIGRLDGGILHVLLDWHVFALIAVGYASMTLSQASLQAGPLGPAVGSQMALDALTSVAIGVLAFGERLHTTSLGDAAALAGIAVMVAGIAALAASGDRPALA